MQNQKPEVCLLSKLKFKCIRNDLNSNNRMIEIMLFIKTILKSFTTKRL